jgi:hypothetical protein
MDDKTDLLVRLRERLPRLDEGELLELGRRTFEEMEQRVGERLSAGLTDAQLDEFEKIIDGGDHDAAHKWLVTTRPDYRDVVAQELDRIVDEVVETVTSGEGPEEESGEPDAAPAAEAVESVRTDPDRKRAQPATPEDDSAIRIRDWKELKHHLHSRLVCRLRGDDMLTTLISLPQGRSQLVYVRAVNDTWAEASSGIGRSLDSDAISTALSALTDWIGIGAASAEDLLVARHGLQYEGLTVASALRGVFAVAQAADEAEQAATGGDDF